jgi:hypothetical protein
MEERAYKWGIRIYGGWMLAWDLRPCNIASCSLEGETQCLVVVKKIVKCEGSIGKINAV